MADSNPESPSFSKIHLDENGLVDAAGGTAARNAENAEEKAARLERLAGAVSVMLEEVRRSVGQFVRAWGPGPRPPIGERYPLAETRRPGPVAKGVKLAVSP